VIQRAYKTELDPTVDQARALVRHIAGARVAHNWVLECWLEYDAVRAVARGVRALAGVDARGGEAAAMLEYALAALTSGQSIGARTPRGESQRRVRYRAPSSAQVPDFSATSIDWYARLVVAKREQPERFGWLNELSSFVIREAVGDVADGWKHFFEHLKAGRYARAGRPKFRPRRAEHYHADQPDPIRVTDRAVLIPGVGWVRLKERGYLPTTEEKSHRFVSGGKAFGLGISRVDGRWYVALRCEVPSATPGKRAPGRVLRERPVPRVAGRKMGVENGVRVLAVGYDGDSSDSLVDTGLRDDERIQKLEMIRKRWERRMARRWQGPQNAPVRNQSKGWFEAKRKVAHYHARIVQLRDDRVGKVVRNLVDRGAETILLREPHVAELLNRDTAPDARTRNVLAPSVHGARMGDVRRRLEYKQVWAGGKVVLVNKFEPVTKRCSMCGAVRTTSPGYPNFRCGACGHVEDRDKHNAPRNLLNYSGGSSSGEADPRNADPKPPKGDSGQEKRQARPEAKAYGTAPQGGETSALGSGNRPSAGVLCSSGAQPIGLLHLISLERSGGAPFGSEQFRSDTATETPTSSNLSQTVSEVRGKSTRLRRLRRAIK
jgi:putative transposase